MEYKIIHIDETDSTNGWLWRSMASDTPGYQSDANVVVVADYQTAGRGCGTNTWESERGRRSFRWRFARRWIPICQTDV